MRNFTFNKEEDNRWYIELPEWEGSHADLEMVAGFNKILDYYSLDGKTCNMDVSEDYIPGSVELIIDREEGGGAVYKVDGCPVVDQVWLCYVTKFVYNGRLPERLYLDPHITLDI